MNLFAGFNSSDIINAPPTGFYNGKYKKDQLLCNKHDSYEQMFFIWITSPQITDTR